MEKPKIIVILGQTATGKSDFAVQVAQKINGEIISADSRQVYKFLNIGTGKITKKEMRGIPHHLIDIVSPKRKFSVFQYQKIAQKKIQEILARKKVPILCGGTGFYLDALIKNNVFPAVPPNQLLRKKLEKKSTLELFRLLKKLDSRRANQIKKKNEINNKVRLIRAIEIAETLGKVPKISQSKPNYKFIKIGLFLSPEILKKKVIIRVKKMFRDGLLKEIENLKKMGITQKRLAEFGFEYNNPTEEKVITETLKYAKRQMTWFQRDKEIKWLNKNKRLPTTTIGKP